MREEIGDQLRVNWRYFPLEQVNSDKGPDWKLWEQPDSHRSRGRPAFQAAIAARRQGDEAFDRFHIALLLAKHEDGKDHGRRQTLLDVARSVDLDLERFERDLSDRSGLPLIGADYEEARDRYGVFGTPTFLFPNGEATYLKLKPVPPEAETMALFEDFVRAGRDRPYLLEVKRPQRPT
ncbi:MAG: DsbA family protein [Chloroflexota bacterium]|nr:DsbA family protein [Chloroflexota bacterium]